MKGGPAVRGLRKITVLADVPTTMRKARLGFLPTQVEAKEMLGAMNRNWQLIEKAVTGIEAMLRNGYEGPGEREALYVLGEYQKIMLFRKRMGQ